MDFTLVWSDAAIADLQDICSYVALHDPQAALRLGSGILGHVHVLESFPFIGPTYPHGVKGTLREIVFRSYRIFYDVSEPSHRIEILHVWHARREEPKFPTGGYQER